MGQVGRGSHSLRGPMAGIDPTNRAAYLLYPKFDEKQLLFHEINRAPQIGGVGQRDLRGQAVVVGVDAAASVPSQSPPAVVTMSPAVSAQSAGRPVRTHCPGVTNPA